MRTINSKFAGKCVHCEQGVARGEQVWWGRGEGVVHLDCKGAWDDYGERQADQHERLMQDPEYAQGARDAEDYRFNKQFFGEDYANAVENQRDFNDQ
jgi:hypothetical protein